METLELSIGHTRTLRDAVKDARDCVAVLGDDGARLVEFLSTFDGNGRGALAEAFGEYLRGNNERAAICALDAFATIRAEAKYHFGGECAGDFDEKDVRGLL